MQRRLDYNLKVRQLLSIQRSRLHISIDNNEHFTNKLDKILLLVSNKKIMFTMQNLTVSIVESLKSLGVDSLTELFQGYNNSHVISLTSFQDKYRNTGTAGRRIMNKHLDAWLLYSAARPLRI